MARIFWVLLVLGAGGAMAYGAWDAGFPMPGIAAGAALGAFIGHLIYSGFKSFARKPAPGADGAENSGLDWIDSGDTGSGGGGGSSE